jgi:hypothetical protein
MIPYFIMICTICQHTAKPAIDDALMQGISVRAVAAQFQLSKSAVARHRTGCLAPVVAAAAKLVAPAAEVRAGVTRAKAIASGQVTATPQEVLSLTGLLDRLARSLERLEGAATAAADSGLHVPLAALSGQIHRGIESAAKIQGMYAEPQPEGGPRLSVTITIPDGFTPQTLTGLRTPARRQMLDITHASIDPRADAQPEPTNDTTDPTPFTVPDFDLIKQMVEPPKGLPTGR